MEHGYCINLKNGMIIHRFKENAERDNACVLFAPISDKVAQAIFDKKVTAADVIRAINNRIRTSDEFDLEKYIEERVKMNVRIQDVDLEKLADQQENGVKEAPIPDKSNVTMDEIKHAEDARKGEAKPPKAETSDAKPPKAKAKTVAEAAGEAAEGTLKI